MQDNNKNDINEYNIHFFINLLHNEGDYNYIFIY